MVAIHLNSLAHNISMADDVTRNAINFGELNPKAIE